MFVTNGNERIYMTFGAEESEIEKQKRIVEDAIAKGLDVLSELLKAKKA